jgi:hypothetical protein
LDEEITEMGEWKTGKGDEDADGREGEEQAVYEVIERVK